MATIKTLENHKGMVAERYNITFNLINEALQLFEYLYKKQGREFSHALNATIKHTGIGKSALCSLTGFNGGSKSKRKSH